MAVESVVLQSHYSVQKNSLTPQAACFTMQRIRIRNMVELQLGRVSVLSGHNVADSKL